MQTRRLDGLGPGSCSSGQIAPVPSAVPVRRVRGWWQTGFLAAIALLVSLSVWVQPILAALPIQSWPDRVALTHFLKPGRYLILFQNPRELRSTGGFLGSFAEVDFGWGLHINQIHVETNIYTRDQAYASQLGLEPPEPLKEFLGEQPWALRDSNWALDFPQAAQTVSWFYEHEGGQPVDGVIAVDARLLQRLLQATGPIALPGYQTLLTADNVVDQLQQEVEKDYWQDSANIAANQPKQILADLLPQLLGRLKHLPLASLADIAVQAFNHKEILVEMADPQLEAAFAHADWAGAVAQTPGDYLYVNESNLTPVNALQRTVGSKSSWSIDRTMTLKRAVESTGKVTHTLTLDRHHIGTAVWPDGPNDSFIRVAVPLGATLVSAHRGATDISGEVRQSQEAGKTVFGVWSRLEPGDQETITLVYQTNPLPSSSLYLQMQPGLPSLPVAVWNGAALDWQGSLTGDFQLQS